MAFSHDFLLKKALSRFIMEAESLRVVPSGESGEICFGGVLANRYWHLPELTASKFVDTARPFELTF